METQGIVEGLGGLGEQLRNAIVFRDLLQPVADFRIVRQPHK